MMMLGAASLLPCRHQRQPPSRHHNSSRPPPCLPQSHHPLVTHSPIRAWRVRVPASVPLPLDGFHARLTACAGIRKRAHAIESGLGWGTAATAVALPCDACVWLWQGGWADRAWGITHHPCVSGHSANARESCQPCDRHSPTIRYSGLQPVALLLVGSGHGQANATSQIKRDLLEYTVHLKLCGSGAIIDMRCEATAQASYWVLVIIMQPMPLYLAID